MNPSDKESQSTFEVINYIKAMDYGFGSLAKRHISNKLLCEVHKELMDSTVYQQIGQFRTIQTFSNSKVRIMGQETYNPPSPDYMRIALIDFEKYMKTEDGVDSLIKLALIHYQLETIRPFLNGNGRLGRILVNLFLHDKKLLSRPLLCSSHLFLLNKTEYFDRIEALQRYGEYELWIKFFIKAVIIGAEESINIIDKVCSLQEKNLAKIMMLGKSSKTAMLLYNYIQKNPIIEIKTVSEALSLSFNAVASAVECLQSLDILKQSNALTRNRTFAYQDYLDVLYSDL